MEPIRFITAERLSAWRAAGCAVDVVCRINSDLYAVRVPVAVRGADLP